MLTSMIEKNSCHSFNDICKIVVDFASDKMDYRPSELIGKYEFIKYFIRQYNELGFLTISSQPGGYFETIVCKSRYHRREYEKTKCRDLILKDAKYEYGQKAAVCGYMHKDMALKMYDKLKNEDIRISISCLHKNDFYLQSVTFKDGRPMYKELIENETIIKVVNKPYESYNAKELKKLNDIRACGCKCEYDPQRFTCWLKGKGKNLDKKLLEDNYIVYINFMDNRWNNNDKLWTLLLDTLKSVNKTKKNGIAGVVGGSPR